jgi:hypothetical protein
MLAWRPANSCADADDVGDLVVGVHQGKPVYLREVAAVRPAPAQPQRYVWFTPGAAPAGRRQRLRPAPGAVYPAVTLTVTKKPGRERGRRGQCRARARWTRCATP